METKLKLVCADGTEFDLGIIGVDLETKSGCIDYLSFHCLPNYEEGEKMLKVLVDIAMKTRKGNITLE